MVIDIHRHFWRGNQRYYDAQASAEGVAPEKPDWETTAQEHAAEMDASGVDASVMLVADYGDRLGTPHFTIDQENWILAQAQERHPERIIAFYGIDPRRPGAPEKFERAIEEWGMGGIKLHATAGYFPTTGSATRSTRSASSTTCPCCITPASASTRCCTAVSPTRWSSTRWPSTSRA